ncbi:MAG: hypothetical protein FWD02_03055 [Bacteroidales bacterium]|nr:hypothetical protein [Bacteroidales bacterium]
MKPIKIILIIFLVPTFAYGQNMQRRFDNILQRVSRNIERNYRTPNLPGVYHFEITYNKQYEILESVFVDGVQISPISMWDWGHQNLYRKTGNPDARRGYPFFHAEFFTTSEDGSLVGTRMWNRSFSTYTSNDQYHPISSIFGRDFIMPVLFPTNDNREGPIPIVHSVERRLTLSTEVTKEEWLVSDTIYNDVDSWKLVHVRCRNYFFTEEDSLYLANCWFRQRAEISVKEYDLGLSTSNSLHWSETIASLRGLRGREAEVVQFWDGGRTCLRQTYIVSRRSNAVLFYQREKEGVDNTGRDFFDHRFTKFERQGRRYVPTYFFSNHHNYIENTPWFSQSGNRTLIVRTPSSEERCITEFQFAPRGGFNLYLRIRARIDEPSQTILDFWEKYKPKISNSVSSNH